MGKAWGTQDSRIEYGLATVDLMRSVSTGACTREDETSHHQRLTGGHGCTPGRGANYADCTAGMANFVSCSLQLQRRD